MNENLRHLSFSNYASPQFGHTLNKVQTTLSQKRKSGGIAEFINWMGNESKYLWMLNLEDSDFQFLPICLDKMKDLRYINLGNCSRIEKATKFTILNSWWL